MKIAIKRIVGILLSVTAIFGLSFSILAIIQIWRFQPSVEASLASNLDLMDTTIATTVEGLRIVDTSLDTASGNVNSLEGATHTLAQSLRDSTPMVDSLIDLVSQDLPETITATQTSLTSAQSSALLIDNMMTALSQIPLLGLGRYRPEVPLNEALGEVSSSMDSLPASLAAIQASLETANENLDIMELQVTNIGRDIQQINDNLSAARGVIDEYQFTALKLQSQVDLAQEGLHKWITQFSWLLTFVLVWLGIMQIGLFFQGWALTQTKQVIVPAVDEEPPISA